MKAKDLDKRIENLSQRWLEQGRDKEHAYALKNFLTGAGKTDIKALIADVLRAVTPERDTRNFPGIEPGQDPVRETCYKQGKNETIDQIEANVKELGI